MNFNFSNEKKLIKDFDREFGNYLEITRANKAISEWQRAISSSLDTATNAIKQALIPFENEFKNISLPLKGNIDGQVLNSLKEFQNIYNQSDLNIRSFIEPLRLQIDEWQKWANKNNYIFKDIKDYWDHFEEKFKIFEQRAVVVLKKYKWLISPSISEDFLLEIVKLYDRKGRQDKLINEMFIKYFSENNWKKLELMVNDWIKNPLMKKRIAILKNCVKTLKNLSHTKINSAEVILPTLITQIDGFLTDYLNSKNIKWDNLYDDKKGRKGRKDQFRKNIPLTLTTKLDEIMIDIFLDILFQKSIPKLERPFNFNLIIPRGLPRG